MNLRAPTTALLVAALVFFLPSSPAMAGPSVTQSLGNRQVTFPAPVGYSDFTSESKALMAIAQETTRPENRLLALFIEDASWRSHKAGGDLELSHHYRVEVPREFERESLSLRDFAQVRSMLRNRYDGQRKAYEAGLNSEYKKSDLIPNAEQNLRGRLSLPSLKLKVGDIQVLGVIGEGDRYLTAATVTKTAMSVNGRKDEAVVLTISSSALLKDRVVYLFQHTLYKSESDLAAASATYQKWLNEVLSVAK